MRADSDARAVNPAPAGHALPLRSDPVRPEKARARRRGTPVTHRMWLFNRRVLDYRTSALCEAPHKADFWSSAFVVIGSFQQRSFDNVRNSF
jgi:hypothetical protein